MENNRRKGQIYEDRAARFLEQRGYFILERNFRCRQGEIDLVARHEGYLVFVEVKYRADCAKGYPEEAVSAVKQQRIRRTAQYYLLEHHLPENCRCRFDVVAILGNREPRLIVNAF